MRTLQKRGAWCLAMICCLVRMVREGKKALTEDFEDNCGSAAIEPDERTGLACKGR